MKNEYARENEEESKYLIKLLFYVDDLFQKRLQAYLLAHSIFFIAAVSTTYAESFVAWFSIVLSCIGLALVWHQLWMTLRLRFRLDWINGRLKKICPHHKRYLTMPEKGEYLGSSASKCMASWLLKKKARFLVSSGWLSTYGLALLTLTAWGSLLSLTIGRCAMND